MEVDTAQSRVRLMLVECPVLAGLSAVLAVALLAWALRALEALAPAVLILDARTLGFALTVSIAGLLLLSFKTKREGRTALLL